MSANFTWRQWRYDYWNKQLVERWLYVADATLLDAPIDRIPAMPEQLAAIVGAEPAEASEVGTTFVQRIVEALPAGKTSLCGYCADYGTWSADSPNPPHFFGMLWFTCLVAFGFPEADGSFDERLTQVLGRHNAHQCLPQLWEDAARWTRVRRQDGEPVRELVLPPRSDHRPIIGYSHFLAFPNRRDRKILARLLDEAGLTGFEPPVTPVLEAVGRSRRAFSTEFLEDFDDFNGRYARGEDPRSDPFWRAVRQEALDPYTGATFDSVGRSSRTALVFIGDDQGLRPIIACERDTSLPTGFEVHLSEDLLDWPAYITGAGSDLDAPWKAAFGSGQLLPVSARRLIGQGLLVLREHSSGQYEVVSGPAIHGCSRALVSAQLLPAFLKAFPGPGGAARAQPSLVTGWLDVEGCEIQQVDRAPDGLERVFQLLRTMSPPSVDFVGGVRTGSGFLYVPEFLPIVRAPGARTLDALLGETEERHPCVAIGDRPGDWRLPSVIDRPGPVTLRASWELQSRAGSVERTSNIHLELVEYLIDDHYRGKPSGHYFVESCPEPEMDVESASDVPLGIATEAATNSSDLLEFDASARFLGPGLGEMSLEPKLGFDWLVVGKKKNPELLMFVGDAEHPQLPAARRSSSKSDQRHWRRGFAANRTMARKSDGRFVDLAAAPSSVRDAYAKYKAHQALNGLECPPTNLETHIETDLDRAEPFDATTKAVDVIAALASRRAGLSYSEVQEIFGALLGKDEPIQLQQILRAWTEAGLFDMLRGARVSRFTFVPRRPHFVLVRRGPEVEATLLGLVTSVRRRQIERALERFQPALVHHLLPANVWQPSTIRIRCDLQGVEAIRRSAELAESEWLDWPTSSHAPSSLDVKSARERILRTAPPDSYRFDAGWDWGRTSFYRGHRSGDPIRLERRVHVDASVIYVVTQEDAPILWTHSRVWALLEAYATRGTPPFEADRGLVVSTGRAPVHLPLPLGRLCVLIGEALPGPVIGAEIMPYTYPFGARLFGLVERVLPAEWLRSPIQATGSINAGSNR